MEVIMDIISNQNVTILHPFVITTAEILYYMPDHPGLLQSFIWQDFDQSPDFPKLRDFLNFWDRSIDGKVKSVYITESGFLKEYEFKYADWLSQIH